MSMLKTTMSSHIFITNKLLVTNKVGGIKGDSNNKLIEKFIKPKIKKLSKSQKLSKSRKSKSKKLAKSKKLSKSRNLFKFATKKARLNFLTPDTRITFNYLQLIFTKALIL